MNIKYFTISIYVTAIAVCLYYAYQFGQILTYIVQPIEKLKLITNADDNFVSVGFIAWLVTLVVANITVIKLKQIGWIIFPYLLAASLIIMSTLYMGDAIFNFKKHNIKWDGSFNGGIIGAMLLVFALMIIAVINLIIVLFIIKRQKK